MLEEEELRESILLVFANKQDQKGALNASQVSRGTIFIALKVLLSTSVLSR
jgi:ADP-ribosylation factor-like protein 1